MVTAQRLGPLLQLLRSVLQLASGNWSNDAIMTLAMSGLAGLSLDEADELENYVLLHRMKQAGDIVSVGRGSYGLPHKEGKIKRKELNH
jgi:hypothetical protein